MERAKRSGGLHKRSAEDWGHGLRARGAELPLGVWRLLLGRVLRAGTGPQSWVADDARSRQEAGQPGVDRSSLELRAI